MQYCVAGSFLEVTTCYRSSLVHVLLSFIDRLSIIMFEVKRRGVVRASITRLSTRLNELESRSGDPSVPDLAKQMMTKIESLDSEFKTLHYAVVDETEGKESLLAEQDILYSHDDTIADMVLRTQCLAGATCSDDTYKKASRGLHRLRKALSSIEDAIMPISVMRFAYLTSIRSNSVT